MMKMWTWLTLLLFTGIELQHDTFVSSFTPTLCRQHCSITRYLSIDDNGDNSKNSDEISSSSSSSSSSSREDAQEFMEEASLNGADVIREMSIEERTKRAMLAEAVEDRIFEMTEELDILLEAKIEDGSKQEEKVKAIALQIKASQEQYSSLVSGKKSSMLDNFESFGK